MWLDVLRVGATGVVLGLLVGKLVVARPHYLRILHPRFWLPIARRMGRRDWLRLFCIAIVFAGLAFFVIRLISDVDPETGEVRIRAIGWETYSPVEYPFEKLREISFPLLLLTVNILPVFEEWIFRGILLEEIARRGRSRSLGVFLSTLAFAVFHLSNPGTYLAFIVPGFAAGLVYSACYLSSGLPGAIGTHCLYNSIVALFF